MRRLAWPGSWLAAFQAEPVTRPFSSMVCASTSPIQLGAANEGVYILVELPTGGRVVVDTPTPASLPSMAVISSMMDLMAAEYSTELRALRARPRLLSAACHRSSTVFGPSVFGSPQLFAPLVRAARSSGFFRLPLTPKAMVKFTMCCQNAGFSRPAVRMGLMALSRSGRRSFFQ